jgi:hypothetical protein
MERACQIPIDSSHELRGRAELGVDIIAGAVCTAGNAPSVAVPRWLRMSLTDCCADRKSRECQDVVSKHPYSKNRGPKPRRPKVHKLSTPDEGIDIAGGEHGEPTYQLACLIAGKREELSAQGHNADDILENLERFMRHGASSEDESPGFRDCRYIYKLLCGKDLPDEDFPSKNRADFVLSKLRSELGAERIRNTLGKISGKIDFGTVKAGEVLAYRVSPASRASEAKWVYLADDQKSTLEDDARFSFNSSLHLGPAPAYPLQITRVLDVNQTPDKDSRKSAEKSSGVNPAGCRPSAVDQPTMIGETKGNSNRSDFIVRAFCKAQGLIAYTAISMFMALGVYVLFPGPISLQGYFYADHTTTFLIYFLIAFIAAGSILRKSVRCGLVSKS